MTDHLLPTVILKAQLPTAVQALPSPIFKPGQKSGEPYIAIKPLMPQFLQPPAPLSGARPADAAARGTANGPASSLEADCGVQQDAAQSQQHAGIRRLHLYCITVACASEQTGPDDTGERPRSVGQLLCWLTFAYATLAAGVAWSILPGYLAKLHQAGIQRNKKASTDALMLQVMTRPAPLGC